MKKIPLKLLVVSAYKNELAGLVNLGRKHFVKKNDIGFLTAGIGPVAASFGLTHLLKTHAPKQIIGIATAGSLNPKKIKIGNVVEIISAFTACGQPEFYSPKKNAALKNTIPSKFLLKTTKTVNAYCPQEITQSKSYALKLQKKGYDIETLEAYALLFVSQKFKTPVRLFAGITNEVGPNSHAQWLENEVSVVKELHRCLVHFLK